MANTYGQAYIHTIFAVKYRAALLMPEWRQEIFAYMAAVVDEMGQKSMIINGVEDHVHMLWGMKPTICIADTMEKVKTNASRVINLSERLNSRFEWQTGYGYFTHSKSQVKRVTKYIEEQEAHHQQQKFADEYTNLLKKWGIAYDSRYVFDEPM